MQPLEQSPQGFTGTISLRLTDLIQMVCLSRSDVVIRVSSQSGAGIIYIRQGQIQHAQTDHLTGENAFFEILGWNDGQFEIQPFVSTECNSINKPWEHLLLEAMRHHDEKGDIRPLDKHDSANGMTEKSDLTNLFENLEDCLFPEPSKSPPQHSGPVLSQASARATKVLIVDDSPFFSKKLKEMLEPDPDIEVVGIASNGKELLGILESGISVDLITLDIEMPVMPGETTIKHVMVRYRRPVVIISSLHPNFTDRVFDFLQLGAVDFMSKPEAGDEHSVYASTLRKLVKRASKAQVSNFRRLRKTCESGLPATSKSITSKKLLVIVGAEGAHIEWFRLPLYDLSRHWIVIGLQRLSDCFVPGIGRLIESKTGIRTEPLWSTHRIAPGAFYLGNASRVTNFRFNRDDFVLDMEATGSAALDWQSGIQSWLCGMAEQAGESMRICFLSGAEEFPPDITTKLLSLNVEMILPPSQSLVCTQMVKSIHPYTGLFPKQILLSAADNLPECLLQ